MEPHPRREKLRQKLKTIGVKPISVAEMRRYMRPLGEWHHAVYEELPSIAARSREGEVPPVSERMKETAALVREKLPDTVLMVRYAWDVLLLFVYDPKTHGQECVDRSFPRVAKLA